MLRLSKHGQSSFIVLCLGYKEPKIKSARRLLGRKAYPASVAEPQAAIKFIAMPFAVARGCAFSIASTEAGLPTEALAVNVAYKTITTLQVPQHDSLASWFLLKSIGSIFSIFFFGTFLHHGLLTLFINACATVLKLLIVSVSIILPSLFIRVRM